MAIEIVDLPTQNGDFLQFFVCLPEGIFNQRSQNHQVSFVPSLSDSMLLTNSPTTLVEGPHNPYPLVN